MEEFIQRVCGDIVKQYRRDKNVLGILLFGSAARGKCDKYSDIDFYILLRKKGEFSRSNFIKNGVRVDIIFDTIKETNDFLKKDRYDVRRITSQMLAHGKILFQKRNELEKILTAAKKNLTLKTRYKQEELLMHKYSIDDFWGEVRRDIEKKDYVAFGIDSNLLINNIVELFIKSRGGFLKQPNEMRDELKKLDRAFSRQVESFYKANDFHNKERVLADLVKYVYRKSGGPLPRKWVLKGGA